MSIIPLTDTLVLTIYQCGHCGRHFKSGVAVSCTVKHVPGSCCHQSDKEISFDSVELLIELLKQAEAHA